MRLQKGLIVLLAVLTAAGVPLGGCARKPKPQPMPQEQVLEEPTVQSKYADEQRLVFNLGAEPPTLDPALAMDSASSTPIYQIFEGLTQRKLDGSGVEPAVAEGWTISEDGTEYTFHVRDGVSWTNGDPVTAEDFEFAWKRVLDPRTGSEYAYLLWYIEGAEEANSVRLPDRQKEPEAYAKAVREIEELLDEVGVEAVDSKNLKVRLVAPAPFFLNLMAFCTFLPVNRNAVASNPDAWAAEPATLVSNGPFRLVEWNHKSDMILVRNEKYWDRDEVKLDEIKMVMIGDPATSLAAYESGQIDMSDNGLVPLSEVPRLLQTGEAKRKPLLASYYLDFNCSREPFTDRRVRLALSLAIDRSAIVENITRGGELPAFAFVPPGIRNPATGDDFRAEAGDLLRGPDVETAKKLLADAGYPDGKGFPKVTLTYHTGGSHKSIMEAIQQMWKANLGIEVGLVAQELPVFLESRVRGDFFIARSGWTGDYVDPTTFLDLFMSTSPQNSPRFKNKAFDELVAKSKTMTDQGERMDALHQAEKILIDESPVAPIYFYVQVWQQRDYVKDVANDIQQNWGFKYAWIERH